MHKERPLKLRSWRPDTGHRNGNSREVQAGVVAEIGVLAGVLAGRVVTLLSLSLSLHKGPSLPAFCSQHPHFCQHLCQHPSQHFSGIPVSGSYTRSQGSQLCSEETLSCL